MQFKRRMQQSGVSTMNTWPIFSKLFHLQLAAIHTQARGQEKRCCSFMLLQPAFLLPVNLKISQNWLVLEWRGTDGSVLPLFLCLWDSLCTANCHCPGQVSSAVSFRVRPHCCQMLDCYALPYFPLLILPQNLRRRFYSEVARLSPALTLAAASCNGSSSCTGRSFSAAAIRVCSRWQLPVKARAKGRFWRPWTADFPLHPQDTHGASSGDPDLPPCLAHPHPLNSLLLTTSYTSSTRKRGPALPASLQDVGRKHERLPIFL